MKVRSRNRAQRVFWYNRDQKVEDLRGKFFRRLALPEKATYIRDRGAVRREQLPRCYILY